MKRRESAELFSRSTARGTAWPWQTRYAKPMGRVGFVGMVLALLLGAPNALAEPAEDALDRARPRTAVSVSADLTSLADAAASHDAALEASVLATLLDDADAAIDLPPATGDASRVALAKLLFVRDLGASSWRPRTTDEILAAAVARGTNSALVPRNAFRKRSRDLFRTERSVSIGETDLLLRLRVRAKASEAVSVEIRF